MSEAEFDQYAEEYYQMHKAGLRLSGEAPEYFAAYKIEDTKRVCAENFIQPSCIFDFGAGIGNSIPWFRKEFPVATLICADVSNKSLEISKIRFPGNEMYLPIQDNHINLEDGSVDLVFTTCVFHHIPENEHAYWFSELRRILKVNGLLIVFEHNPNNPLTVSTVKHCPFDVNAKLIKAKDMEALFKRAGLVTPHTKYRIFFPSWLSFLRPLEKVLMNIPFGAQYYTFARK